MTFSTSDKRRMTLSSSASAADMDRETGFLDVRCYRAADSVQVAWKGPPALELDGLSWSVERSGGPAGPFRVCGGPFAAAETNSWRDDAVPTGREMTLQVYYRIRLHREDQEDEVFGYLPDWERIGKNGNTFGFTWAGPSMRSAYASGPVREVRQRFATLIQRFGGMEGILYRRAWTEGPCPVCTNGLTGVSYGEGAGATCTSCLGSGCMGGYFTPIRVQYVPDRSAQYLTRDMAGTLEARAPGSFLFPYWPIVEPGDLVRTLNGEIWSCIPAEPVCMYDMIAVQPVTVQALPRTHPLNSVPLPSFADLATLGPRRQHGRALTLTSYRQSLEDGAAYHATVRSFGTEEASDD